MPPVAAIGCLLIFGVSVASVISAGKVLVGEAGWSPLMLMGVQNIVAAGLVFCVSAALGQSGRAVLKHLPFFILSAACGIAFPQAIAFLVAPHLGAAMTSVTYLFPPLLTFVFALAFSMEKLDTSGVVAILLGVLGGALLFWGQGLLPGASKYWLGVALLAPVAQAGGNIYRSKYWPSGIPILMFTAAILLATGLMGFALAPLLGGAFAFPPISGRDGALILGCIAAAGIGYSVFFYLQRRAGPVYVSQGGFVIAGFGALFGTLIFGEALAATAIVGAGIVAIGICLFTVRAARKR
ncbi:MAG: DMT family transporter [Pseudomonadota bacterium]